MFGAEVPEWVLGALICLFGSTLTALGLVLQKHSHTLSEHSDDKECSYYLRKWWIFGFAVFISAQIINMVAMAMTPQVVLSCLGSWTLVCNAAFAHLILNESLSSAQVVSVVGLVVAMAMVIYNAPRPTSDQPPRHSDAVHLAQRFLSPEVEVLSTIFLGLICLGRSLAVGLQRAQSLEAASRAPDLGGARAPAPRQVLAPLSWAMMAAVSAGYTALLFKCIAEIIAGAVSRPEAPLPPWYCWETYMIAGVAFSCAPTELHCLNLALKSGEAVFVIPMYLTLAMMAQLITGAVFFQEFSNFHSRSHAWGFAIGVLLTIVFVVAMAKAQDDHYQRLADRVDNPDLSNWLIPEPGEEEQEQQEPPRQSKSDLPPRISQPEGPLRNSGLDFLYDPRSEKQIVSVAGFGGAIEILEARRARGRSDFPHDLRCSRPPSVGRAPFITRLDRATSSPV